jgi:hypothetical protein
MSRSDEGHIYASAKIDGCLREPSGWGLMPEDRHNPLPHIAPSTTALKSAYKNTAFLSTRTAAELRELLIPNGREWWFPGRSSSSADVAGLREVCYRAKAAAFQFG